MEGPWVMGESCGDLDQLFGGLKRRLLFYVVKALLKEMISDTPGRPMRRKSGGLEGVRNIVLAP